MYVLYVPVLVIQCVACNMSALSISHRVTISPYHLRIIISAMITTVGGNVMSLQKFRAEKYRSHHSENSARN